MGKVGKRRQKTLSVETVLGGNAPMNTEGLGVDASNLRGVKKNLTKNLYAEISD